MFLVYLEICGGDNGLFKFFIVPKETMVSLGISGHPLNLDAPFILILFVAPRNDWEDTEKKSDRMAYHKTSNVKSNYLQ